MAKRVYFRDFVDTFIAAGGDISRIFFESSELVHKYRIIKRSSSELECERITAKSKHDQITRFPWTGRENSSSNIHNRYYVQIISQKRIGKGLRLNNSVMVTLGKANTFK